MAIRVPAKLSSTKLSRAKSGMYSLSRRFFPIFPLFWLKGFFVPPNELLETKHGGVSIAKERRVVKIDPIEKKALLDDGVEIRFNKCLLATGFFIYCFYY